MTSARPRVTVGISFHDEEVHLAPAIRSILAQTERDLELLLVDDGSTDGSLTVARRFAAEDARVRLLPSSGRRFLAARLNELVAEARAPFFARMDADDVSHPSRLERQLEHLDRAPTALAVGSWAAIVDDREIPFAVLEASSAPSPGLDILRRGIIPHATMLARTAWLAEVGYDASLTRAEDRDLWCRVGRTARIDAIGEVLYVVRVLVERPGFLDDYLRGKSDLRRVIARHGPDLAGRIATGRLLGDSLLKEQAMRLAVLLGAHRRLTERRGRRPSAAERDRALAALAAAAPPIAK